MQTESENLSRSVPSRLCTTAKQVISRRAKNENDCKALSDMQIRSMIMTMHDTREIIEVK